MPDADGDVGVVGGAAGTPSSTHRSWRASSSVCAPTPAGGEARGEELVDLVVDLAGPDARRLDARAAFDLARGGWATRWREHPPLHTWLLYRFFDRRIPVAYRSWALDDIDGYSYPMRSRLAGFLCYPLFLMLAKPGIWLGVWPVVVVVDVVLVAVLLMSGWPEAIRSRARLKHVAPRSGVQPVEATFVARRVLVERATARSALTWAVLFLGITGVMSLVAALLAPKVILAIPIPNGVNFAVGPVGARWVVAVAILAVALGLGVLGGLVARRRLNRLLVERPDQPHRVLRPVSARDKANVFFWSVIIAAFAWLEVSGLIVLGLSVVLGTVALFLLPGALVALVVTRGGAPDLAGRDVWSIAARGWVPTVDEPVTAMRPLPGPVTEGVLVQPRGPADPAHPSRP